MNMQIVAKSESMMTSWKLSGGDTEVLQLWQSLLLP